MAHEKHAFRSGFWSSLQKKGQFNERPFIKIDQQNIVLHSINQARNELITGLESVEVVTGWLDPTREGAQSLWTSLEVCKSLLEAGCPVKNLTTIISRIQESKKTFGVLTGWESESLPDLISTYLTSDAGLLFLTLGEKTEVITILDTLINIQNSDGGWGVCNGDNISKTRATGFVLKFFAACLNSPWAYHHIDLESYSVGIKWLTRAWNDTDGGWSNLADTPPSNIAATSVALDALLSTEKAVQQHSNIDLRVRGNVIRAGLRMLVNCNNNGEWRGNMEEFGIQIEENNKILRHTASGVGTLVIAQVLAKSVYLNYLSPEDQFLLQAIDDILRRCKGYRSNRGKWIVPSDQDGPPTAWNSAFALDALKEFEQLYLSLLKRGYCETHIVKSTMAKSKRWQQVSVFLAILIVVILLFPRLSFLGDVIVWFNTQTPWVQGIIMIFITLTIERTISGINALFKKYISRS